jgi:hypothetical protein
MDDLHLLRGRVPEETGPHAAIVVSGGTITSLWARRSYADALETLRCWYAVRRTLYAIDEAGLDENTVGDEAYGPLPATAAIEEISEWYSDGDRDYSVTIAPIEQLDPLELCLREEIPGYPQEYRSEVREAVLDVTAPSERPGRDRGSICDALSNERTNVGQAGRTRQDQLTASNCIGEPVHD